MKKADHIRKYVLDNYIEPARRRGDTSVAVRAGDVHKATGLRNSIPAVASAPGANKSQPYPCVRLVKREGPHVDANLGFTCDIL